jgi:transmembrane sensor
MINPDHIFNMVTGNMEPEQKQAICSEVKKNAEAKVLYKRAKLTWALMSSSRKAPDYKIEASYRSVHERIFPRKSIFRIHSYLRYAAMVVLAIGIPLLTFFLGRQNKGGLDPMVRYTNVIADKGQISKVILPDSSVVWLNSGTTLTYDHNFGYKNRELNLEGEAYVVASKNKDLPMIVASDNLKVRVLGTRFNVDAYSEEELIKVTLETGQIELLNSTVKRFRVQMRPGQMAEFTRRTGNVEVRDVRSQNYTNWKNGELIFIDTPMDEVIRRLERKFDIETEVRNRNFYKSVFNATFKSESLKEILDYIQYSCTVSYQLIREKGTTRVIFK